MAPLAALMLAACAGERPPLHKPYDERHRYGYQDLEVSHDGARVRYIGPVRYLPVYAGHDAAVEAAVREAQELALLRAVELARQTEVRFLTVEQRRTDVNVRERIEYDPFPFPPPYIYHGRYPYYHRYGFPPYHGGAYYRSEIGRVTVTLEVRWRESAGEDRIDAAETLRTLRRQYGLDESPPSGDGS